MPPFFTPLCTAVSRCYHHSENEAPILYQKLSEDYTTFARDVILPIVQKSHGGNLLKAIATWWERYKLFVDWMRKCFSKLDSTAAYTHTHDKPCVTVLGFRIFKVELFSHVLPAVSNAVLQLIQRYRQQEDVDLSLFKAITELYLGMGACEIDIRAKSVAEFIKTCKNMENGMNL